MMSTIVGVGAVNYQIQKMVFGIWLLVSFVIIKPWCRQYGKWVMVNCKEELEFELVVFLLWRTSEDFLDAWYVSGW